LKQVRRQKRELTKDSNNININGSSISIGSTSSGGISGRSYSQLPGIPVAPHSVTNRDYNILMS